jgi:hypothetical protein
MLPNVTKTRHTNYRKGLWWIRKPSGNLSEEMQQAENGDINCWF